MASDLGPNTWKSEHKASATESRADRRRVSAVAWGGLHLADDL